MKKILFTLSLLIMLYSCGDATKSNQNPFFAEFDTPNGLPPFDKIESEHFEPAYEEAIKQRAAEIEKITSNPEPATFENTILALDNSGEMQRRISGVFGAISGTYSDDSLKAINVRINPRLQESSDNIYLNKDLFERVKTVYNAEVRKTYNIAQNKLIEDYYKSFVRSGIELNAEEQTRMRQINKDLSEYTLKFRDNLLSETTNAKLFIDNEADLAGLPKDAIAAAAIAAKANGQEGKWMFSAGSTSWIPFLQYAENRGLREQLYKKVYMRGDNDNDLDNKTLINKIVNLRLEMANMLGYKNYAEYSLENTMAKTPQAVMTFLKNMWNYALPQAQKEEKELLAMAHKLGDKIDKIESWDWFYYAEKIRQEKYALDEEELKPYFMIDNVRDGVFYTASKLYGISFKQLTDVPVYDKDVQVFQINGENDKLIGFIYLDYFARDGRKRPGAWMSSYRKQSMKDGKIVHPIIYNVGNFNPPVGDAPALITTDQANTMFHEFGHALHGLLSECEYYSQSGTSVPRDFVELPSQILEHWAFEPEVLKIYAKHYQTGEIIPDELVKKIENAALFNQGFENAEFLAAAILDMNWHMIENAEDFNVRKFEEDAMKKIGLISSIVPRYRSTYFQHIFAGGYAAGYYSYRWAEVLDSDAFQAFKETGDIFNPATAKLFRHHVLSQGGSDDPMTLYKKFRGKEPDAKHLLRNRGFIK